jgi:signal transduction histidine kinase/CheY-like chemotaxis protein
MVQCADAISSSLSEMEALANNEALPLQPMFRNRLEDLIGTCFDSIDTIQACAMHQKRIVDDILTLSKLDSKLLVISPIIIQPAALLQDSYKMFKEEASKARVSLEVCCDRSFTNMNIDYAILDPSRVLQILINLLTNAIKFTSPQSKRKVEVIMGASRDTEKRQGVQYVPQKSLRQDFLNQREWGDGESFYLHFTVKDTGCGLSPEHKEKLFLRFSQATPRTHVQVSFAPSPYAFITNEYQYGGSGLGLFISRELAEMQGGSIGVQSIQGVGSTFSFYIRSRRAGPPSTPSNTWLPSRTKAQIITNSETPSPKGSVEAQAYPKYHILVVEDNLINQRVLCNQLRKIGCTVQVANHGREALQELTKTSYWKTPTVDEPFSLSVVLMDVEMPILDGNACAREVRALQRKGEIVGHVPIIAVSANARKEQIDQAKQAGMDDAISKPFRIPELMNIIASLLGRLG